MVTIFHEITTPGLKYPTHKVARKRVTLKKFLKLWSVKVSWHTIMYQVSLSNLFLQTKFHSKF